MKETSGLNDFFNKSADWISRFAIVNLFWFILNIPLFFLLFSVLFIENHLIFIISLLLLIPPLFYPSTIAMVAATRDWVLKKDQESLVKAYFSYFKENYRNGMKVGAIFSILWGIWMIDFYFFKNLSGLMGIVFLIIGALLFVCTLNSFSLIAHYRMNVKTILKNIFLITFASPLSSLLILLISLTVIYGSIKFTFLLPFFTGSIIAYFSFLVLYQFILKKSENERLPD